MREIKFRAWDRERKKMINADGLIFQKEFHYMKEEKEYIDRLRLDYREEFLNHIQKNYILLQYTGLKDNRGKEIYEGDIIRWLIFTEDIEDKTPIHIIDTVGFSNGYYYAEKRCEILGLKAPYREVEVIGNIYENPELLETK